MRRDENVLHGIKGIVGITKTGEGDAVQRITVTLYDFGKGAVLSTEAESHKLIVSEVVAVTAHDDLR